MDHPRKGTAPAAATAGLFANWRTESAMPRYLHVSFHAQQRLAHKVAGTAAITLACLFGIGFVSAAEPESLGEVRLSLTKLPPPPPEERRPRVAFFLIDCSSSMRKGISEELAGPNDPLRWTKMREGLQQTLAELLEVSPGIEVRLRFFGTFLDCTGQGKVAVTLNSPVDVDVLMAKVPEQAPTQLACTSTALYESTVKCIEQLRQENQLRKFEWWLFGIFSDGSDGIVETRVPRPKPREELRKERDAQLLAMQEEGAAPPLVWIVGPEAQKVANRGEYGPANIKQLGDSIPKPPPQPTRFTLELASDQPGSVQLDRAAKAGRHRITVNVAGDFPAGSGLTLRPSIDGASPFRVLTKEVSVRPGTPGVVELDLPQDVDRAKGASATLVLSPPVTVKDNVVFSGQPRVSFTFTADRTLPLDQWILDHIPAERRGVKTRFFANPGQATSPQWVFKGPGGEVEREDGFFVSRAFSVAGPWECEFTCTSESGEKLAKPAGTIEIIDADFSINPAEKMMDLGEEVSFEIVPAQGATSPATYTYLLDGTPISAGQDGKTITLPSGSIDRIGQHLLDVVARSRVGDFEWRSIARILVDASPRIAIMPTEFVEGSDVKVAIEATGDIGESVLVYANDKLVDEYPVVYPPSGAQVKQLTASIPAAGLTRAELAITVRPQKEGACDAATATIKGRPAEIFAAMKSPTSGSKVSAKGGRQLVLEPRGDHAGNFRDVRFLVAIVPSGESPDGDDLIAEESNRWTVSIPRQTNLGKTDVYAKPDGGHLQPDVFPKGWKKIGSLEVVPEAQWIPFLLSLLAILTALYFIWTGLTGNRARRWIVQTAIRPRNDAGYQFFDTIPLHSREHGIEPHPSYGGWPLRNWFPRLPPNLLSPLELDGKKTTIYLWQLLNWFSAEKKWVRDILASGEAQTAITINGKKPLLVFENLPSNQRGGYWTEVSVDDEKQTDDPRYSQTFRLTRIDNPQHSLWIRVQQPAARPIEDWIFIALSATALVCILYLLRFFHFF